jgi:hypothetical protein
MKISVSSNVVTIDGNIKSVMDYQNIKSTIDALIASEKSITLNILNSLSMTSSVIGYLNKLVLKDKIDITTNIGNAQLMDLFDDLNLIDIFKARKV